MKFLLIFAGLLGLGAAQSLVDCNDFEENALVPHPESCYNYFQCMDGVAYEAACPRGMHFSPSQLVCMSYNEANCTITDPTPPPTPTPPTPPAPSCEGVPNLRFIPHPNSCEDYFKCIDGTAFQISCPRGLYFSEPIQTCDYPQNVNCVTLPPPTPTPTPPPQNVCVGVADFQLIAHPVSCALFFQCISEREFIASCAVEQYFDDILARCMDSWLVDCGSRNRRPEVTTSPPVIDTQCIGITNNTRVPDPNSCLSFYECINGRASLQYCAEGLWFDEERLECDDPENVLCQPTTPPGTAPTAPTAPTADPLNICEGVENGTYLGSNIFCESFYLCIDDRAFPDVCVDGYWFDLEQQHCRPIDEVDCTLSTIAPTTTSPTTTTETMPLTLCHEARNGTYVANRMACNEFFVCLNEEPHPRRCQQGLWFSFIQQRCTTVYETQCDLYPIFCLGAEDDVPFRAPASCTDFVTCYDGVPYSSQCWNNLFFDEATGQCLPPDEVECDLVNIPTEPPRTPCDGARDFGLVASWDSCVEHFLCYADEIWDTLQCPEGQIFNEARQVCGGEGEGEGFECWL